MEFVWMSAFAVFLFGVSVFLGLVTVRLTRHRDSDRGWLVVGAFFAPLVFVIYLLTASHFREKFHYDRLEASNFDGSCTLPLGNGYNLLFFDEMPSAASIDKGDWRNTGVQVLSRIQKVNASGPYVYGQTGTSDWEDSPTDFAFSLKMATGEVKKFKNEAEMRANLSGFGRLMSTDDAFRAAESRTRTILFWPTIGLAPFVIIGLFIKWTKKWRINQAGLE